ncbi:hemin storage protein [Stenotrophomonas terrae]|uniref:Hemin storage protein n=1 Tax=Stenotrophomonas terrae TaxID=405446 RepID=A0A0R0D223_9GAMM|nr:poly-beta-1,6 N-acetyl-D-glucosamine export porin PgaA [Stenotrophomonas terrae]KRG72634.1 hemin storage protein [Stenotrophomonas terrae]
MDVWKPLALSAALALTLYAGNNNAVAAPSIGDATLASITAYRQQGQWLQALAEIQRLQQRSPQDAVLYQLQVLTLSDIGNAAQAWRLAQARPTLFDKAQQQRLDANYLSKLVGWSLAYGKSEQTQLAEAEQALAHMQQLLDADSLSPRTAPPRIRYDRLILLNRLARHAQVREEYRDLVREGLTPPDYVLPAVGDSLLASRHPLEAIPVLQAAARNKLQDGDQSRSELAYALLESGQTRTLIAQLQQWRDAETPFLRREGAKQSFQNWARYDADITLSMVRAYSGDLPTAQRELEGLAEKAPANGGLLSSLGKVYQMRGWPRRGLQYQQMAHTLEPRELPARLGMQEAWMELQRDDLARPLHDDMQRLHPDQPEVQRMHQLWRVHRGWQAYAYSNIGRSSGGDSPLGDQDRHSGVELQSPVLDDRWRIVAFADRRSVDYTQRTLKPLRTGGGVRYAHAQLDAELLLNHANDGIGGTGAQLGLGWQFNDYWHAAATMVRNDAEASLQARAAGISANSASLAARYRSSERSRWNFALSRFHYSDGNDRDLAEVGTEQRLFTSPTLLVDGLVNAYAGRGSRDDVPYFNPSRDAFAEAGVRLDHLTWRHYDQHFRQQLTLAVANYWQQGYGTALIPRAEYRHEWQLGLGRVLEYGVNWSRPVYDGRREQHIGLDAAFRWGQ